MPDQGRAMNLPHPLTLVTDINCLTLENVCNALDEQEKWTDLYRKLPRTQFLPSIYSLRQGTNQSYRLIFDYLGERGCTVERLIALLHSIRHEPSQIYIRGYEPIRILQEPQKDNSCIVGDSVSLRIGADGFPYPHYNWFFCHCDNHAQSPTHNFTELLGEINSELKLENISLNEAGVYKCRVHNHRRESTMWSNLCCVNVAPLKPSVRLAMSASPRQQHESCSSRDLSRYKSKAGTATLFPPKILQQPLPQIVYVGDKLVLQCKAEHVEERQWYHNGKRIDGANRAIYKISEFSTINEGNYFCRLSNKYASVDSRTVEICRHSAQSNTTELALTFEPVSSTVMEGQTAAFNVRVQGDGVLEYQWFKDNRSLQGENKAEFVIKVAKSDDAGDYHCLISNGRQSIQSKVAKLEIAERRDQPYMAKDKVALLIGNSSYRMNVQLNAPAYDMIELQRVLRKNNFRVISLLDLTKTEMLNAVKKFATLIDEGVYAFVYFAGHGWEYEHQNYIIPVDGSSSCPLKECLCLQYVIQLLKEKKPAMLSFFFDMCRVGPNCSDKEKRDLPVYTSDKRYELGNTAIVFATSSTQEAFEHITTKRSFMVNELLRLMEMRHLTIFNICDRLRMNIPRCLDELSNKEDQTTYTSNPETRLTLSLPLCLSDKVVVNPPSDVYERNSQILEEIKSGVIQEEYMMPHNVHISLEFVRLLDNILCANVTILQSAHPPDQWDAYISNDKDETSVAVTVTDYTERQRPDVLPKKTVAVISSLQKLKDDFLLTLVMSSKINGEREKVKYLLSHILSKRPLISAWDLWQSREPTEDLDPQNDSCC